MSVQLQTLVDEMGMIEALNRMAVSPDTIGLSKAAAQQRLAAATRLLTMSAERSARLLQMVKTLVPSSPGVQPSADEAIAITDSNLAVPDEQHDCLRRHMKRWRPTNIRCLSVFETCPIQ
ncbi:hypothetical protein [Rhizobium sp. R693]|uniref:hypothetical protein n=1 Tax=Rhizobium sp. R693 TaxID=1764276 RepID=UPI000B52E4EA|nr:hypothetical protein [Rhizobium sp. R693]OWV87444.1 hypothetical protein ATY79_29410 [Rhizobium sp. R693]